MYLQRHFAAGADKPCTHVTVGHTGRAPEQKFSDRLLATALVEGWMRREGNNLVLKTQDGEDDLVYTVRREPGYYVKSTGARIPVSDFALARLWSTGVGDLSRPEVVAWLAAHGLPANDYDLIKHFDCVLNAPQHERFCLRKEG